MNTKNKRDWEIPWWIEEGLEWASLEQTDSDLFER